MLLEPSWTPSTLTRSQPIPASSTTTRVGPDPAELLAEVRLNPLPIARARRPLGSIRKLALGFEPVLVWITVASALFPQLVRSLADHVGRVSHRVLAVQLREW